MEKILVLLAGLVFAVSIVWSVQARQRAETHQRARQPQERAKQQSHHRGAHGIMVARLAETGPGRIVVGGRALWLRDGETCAHTVGTPIRVVYTVVDGRRLVDGIVPVQIDSTGNRPWPGLPALPS